MRHLKYLLVLPFILAVINVAQAKNESNFDTSPEYILRVTSDDSQPKEIAYIVQFTTDDGYTSPIQVPTAMTPYEVTWKKIHTINFWLNSSSGQTINAQLIKKDKNKEEIVASGHGLFVMMHANKMGDSYSTSSSS